jgi:hypothetical protein
MFYHRRISLLTHCPALGLWPVLASGKVGKAKCLSFLTFRIGCRFWKAAMLTTIPPTPHTDAGSDKKDRRRKWLLGGYQSVCLLA